MLSSGPARLVLSLIDIFVTLHNVIGGHWYISDSFPHWPHTSGCAQSCQKYILMYRCSPIAGRRSGKSVPNLSHSYVDICFFYFVLTTLWWFFSKRWIDHFEDTKSIVMNYFMYTLKLDNSPCREISTSPTQWCVLQTGSHTTHDSMFRWSKCFKEART